MRRYTFASVVLTAVWWSAQAQAQQIPDELKNAPKETRFLVMQPGPHSTCQVGIHRPGGKFGPFCELSIDECASIPHTHVARTFRGNWSCLRSSS